jgi:hypothetical protein
VAYVRLAQTMRADESVNVSRRRTVTAQELLEAAIALEPDNSVARDLLAQLLDSKAAVAR